MKTIIFLVVTITFFVQPIFAQDKEDSIENSTIQEPLLDRLALEKQFGGYEPPRTPSPLPNVTYKNLDISKPNINESNTGDYGNKGTSLAELEKSLLQREGDGRKMGGSISISLAEAESIANEQNISNEKATDNYSLIAIRIILILAIVGAFIFLFTNKKNNSITEKVEKNDNTIVKKESYAVDKIISSLEKIQMLKESNVITEQQFEKLKKELID